MNMGRPNLLFATLVLLVVQLFGKSTSPHKVGSRAQRSELGLFQVGATVDARHVKVFVWSNLKSILFKSVLHVKFQIYSN
jgi:hypothetical protein